jgi:hypothetical protein
MVNERLGVPRNAVLPQFSTWKTPGGYRCPDIKFPSTSSVYCHRDLVEVPLFTKQDQKTLLAVTNAAVEPVTHSNDCGGDRNASFLAFVWKPEPWCCCVY